MIVHVFQQKCAQRSASTHDNWHVMAWQNLLSKIVLATLDVGVRRQLAVLYRPHQHRRPAVRNEVPVPSSLEHTDASSASASLHRFRLFHHHHLKDQAQGTYWLHWRICHWATSAMAPLLWAVGDGPKGGPRSVNRKCSK